MVYQGPLETEVSLDFQELGVLDHTVIKEKRGFLESLGPLDFQVML